MKEGYNLYVAQLYLACKETSLPINAYRWSCIYLVRELDSCLILRVQKARRRIRNRAIQSRKPKKDMEIGSEFPNWVPKDSFSKMNLRYRSNKSLTSPKRRKTRTEQWRTPLRTSQATLRKPS